eukprot:Selendium_serpulae@DN6335_c0_g1_i3.p1
MHRLTTETGKWDKLSIDHVRKITNYGMHNVPHVQDSPMTDRTMTSPVLSIKETELVESTPHSGSSTDTIGTPAPLDARTQTRQSNPLGSGKRLRPAPVESWAFLTCRRHSHCDKPFLAQRYIGDKKQHLRAISPEHLHQKVFSPARQRAATVSVSPTAATTAAAPTTEAGSTPIVNRSMSGSPFHPMQLKQAVEVLVSPHISRKTSRFAAQEFNIPESFATLPASVDKTDVAVQSISPLDGPSSYEWIDCTCPYHQCCQFGNIECYHCNKCCARCNHLDPSTRATLRVNQQITEAASVPLPESIQDMPSLMPGSRDDTSDSEISHAKHTLGSEVQRQAHRFHMTYLCGVAKTVMPRWEKFASNDHPQLVRIARNLVARSLVTEVFTESVSDYVYLYLWLDKHGGGNLTAETIRIGLNELFIETDGEVVPNGHQADRAMKFKKTKLNGANFKEAVPIAVKPTPAFSNSPVPPDYILRDNMPLFRQTPLSSRHDATQRIDEVVKLMISCDRPNEETAESGSLSSVAASPNPLPKDISFSEFVAACLCTEDWNFHQDLIRTVFNLLDKNKDGFIGAGDLKDTFFRSDGLDEDPWIETKRLQDCSSMVQSVNDYLRSNDWMENTSGGHLDQTHTNNDHSSMLKALAEHEPRISYEAFESALSLLCQP